ncbi:uncharacterized protein LOC102810277 [Saccoglossus kowalevskii]|uniref:Inner centromere protein-like n=1 Tax=Saccoglossus kowalevskii TaxID=10224 RepID=A0ABM0MLE4_SACKO|nr:PREDICTED: inner centromere protein-like [Saccoglossus kowalevskii]
MKVYEVLILLSVMGAAVAEEAQKKEEKTRMNKPVERELHHLSHEKKSELGNHRNKYSKAHPEIEGSPKLVQEERTLLGNKKKKMMEIRKSELSPEAKALKLGNVKHYYRSQMKFLAKEANSHAKLAAERRRTLEQRKEEREPVASARKLEKKSNEKHHKFGDSKMKN